MLSLLKNQIVKRALAGVGVFFGLLVLLFSWFTVEEYERAVVTRWGQYHSVAGPGLRFKFPIIDSVTTYRVDIQQVKSKDPVNTYTIDYQELDALFTVLYRIPAENVAHVYKNVPDYRERLYSIAVDRFKAELGKVNVQHVAAKRGELRDAIRAVLAHDMQNFGLEVVDFQLSNIEYTKSFRASVETAANAKAMVETREQEKRQAEVVAEKAKIAAVGEANAAREKARGEADARLLTAEAEAKAIRLRGEAEAAAIKAQAEALAKNQDLVELRKAERWDGALPTQMLSSVVPFMNVK